MQHRAPLEDFPADAFERLMRTNVSSVFNVGQAVARHMIARGAGKIINIASVQSALARQSIAPYTATKGAVANLTKGMATDWARYGLQVNAIAPGYFDTPLNAALVADPEFTAWLEKRTPAGRWGQLPELRRRLHLPRLGGVELRQRPRPLRGRRNHGEPLASCRCLARQTLGNPLSWHGNASAVNRAETSVNAGRGMERVMGIWTSR